jgi:hypothetical protein
MAIKTPIMESVSIDEERKWGRERKGRNCPFPARRESNGRGLGAGWARLEKRRGSSPMARGGARWRAVVRLERERHDGAGKKTRGWGPCVSESGEGEGGAAARFGPVGPSSADG